MRMLRAGLHLVVLLILLAPGFGCQMNLPRPGRATPPAGAPGGPPFDSRALPGLPAVATGAVRVASDYSFHPTDEYASEGATWEADRLRLSGANLSYAILGSLAGGQQVRSIALDGSCSGLWLGISDYGRGTWRWIAGPLAAAGINNLPPVQLFSDAGEMFVALVCPPGASADVTITLRIDEPGSVITLGPDLPGEQIRPLLGVNCGPGHAGEAGNADLTAEYAALGVNYVRTHDYYGPLDLAEIYPDRTKDPVLEKSYSFATGDLQWQMILDCGVEPYLRLGDSSTNPTPPADAAQRANMAAAAVQIVHHYRDGQWNGFTTPFQYVEIWNEPDGSFWPGHTRLEFFQFYQEAATALKLAFPELKVGGCGFTPAGYLSPAGQVYVTDFLDYVQLNGVPLDFISWHMYSNSPADYLDAAAWYREQLNNYSYGDAESHLTEYNTALTGDAAVDRELRGGPYGAAVLSACWIALQSSPAAIDQALFYRGNDTHIEQQDFFGLYYADGTPKKIAQAFELWHRLCLCPDLVQTAALKPGGGASPLWVLAGRNGADQALLVVNPGATDTTYSLAFSDGSFAHNYAMTLREVSADGNGGTADPTSGILVAIAAHGVQLVELAPLP